MAICNVSYGVVATLALILAIFLPAVQVQAQAQAQPFAPAPAPTSDGTTIDQGIAYVLMLLALVLTYIIHTFDSPLNLLN